ncbi:hypothetical protein Emag_007805 [Eimeria magna]
MLSVLKNALVTGASKEDGGIRKKELDWFSSNCWIVASQAAVVAGFTFSQLSKQPEPETEGAGAWFHLFHAAFTGLGFVCALSVLVRATFSGIYAQGLALRGHEGFSDMAAAVRRLREDQDRILGQFMLAAVGGVSGIEGVYSRVGDLDALSEGGGDACPPHDRLLSLVV